MSITWDHVKEGDSVTPLKKGPITREEIKAYGFASGDTNPIHMDERAGVAAGLGGVIQHGLRSMAFVSQMLTDWAGAPERLAPFEAKDVRVGSEALVLHHATDEALHGPTYSMFLLRSTRWPPTPGSRSSSSRTKRTWPG